MEVSSIPGRHSSALKLLERPGPPELSRTARTQDVLATLRSERARRVLNVWAAVFLLALSAPVMLVIAALIRLTSPGPVLYVQPRVGFNRRNGGRPVGNCRRRLDAGGKLFQMYKFRTMRADAGNGAQVWAAPDDPRVTPMGRVLRKYRLDELPQLINVLRGDMNLVGPRPEQPEIFARLRQDIDHYAERQRVRPGITGWAQVNHSYDRSTDDVRRKLELDLEYLHRQSVQEDLKIMLRTVPVVVFKQGAW